jgi:hypothetical protein
MFLSSAHSSSGLARQIDLSNCAPSSQHLFKTPANPEIAALQPQHWPHNSGYKHSKSGQRIQ